MLTSHTPVPDFVRHGAHRFSSTIHTQSISTSAADAPDVGNGHPIVLTDVPLRRYAGLTRIRYGDESASYRNACCSFGHMQRRVSIRLDKDSLTDIGAYSVQ
jgi:hypothetical protein